MKFICAYILLWQWAPHAKKKKQCGETERKKNTHSIIFMENAHKKANILFNQNSTDLKNRFFVYGGNHLCAGRFIAPLFLLFPSCTVNECVHVVDFISVFVWFPLFVRKFLRILSAFLNGYVHIIASYGNENLAIRAFHPAHPYIRFHRMDYCAHEQCTDFENGFLF